MNYYYESESEKESVADSLDLEESVIDADDERENEITITIPTEESSESVSSNSTIIDKLEIMQNLESKIVNAITTDSGRSCYQILYLMHQHFEKFGPYNSKTKTEIKKRIIGQVSGCKESYVSLVENFFRC
jgi:hypothetical protein